jgi:adenosylcobinamide-GDP ribazoletransferase
MNPSAPRACGFADRIFLPARLALAFLTILPLRLPGELPGTAFPRSAAFFPLAGWLLGGALAVLAWLFQLVQLPSLLSAALLVTALAWLTRGLHLDGLADLLDGLGGGRDPARRLAIMKDSALGAFGGVGLVLLLFLKIAALAALLAQGPFPLWTLVAVPVAARWAMATLAWGTEYPRAQGTGHLFVGRVSAAQLLGGFFFLLPLFWWAGPAFILFLVSALLPALLLRRTAGKALGGVTGDVLGAACELAETCAWLAAVALCGEKIPPCL